MTTSYDQAAGSLPRLWTIDFTVLMTASFLAYANISVFFQYYNYLGTLPIKPAQYGLLMGVFSAASLVFRPIVSTWLNETNSRPYLYLGALLVMVSLGFYSLAGGFWSMLAARIMHGLAFVVMGTALMAIIVGQIPTQRSSQAFGLISIVVMLPNTVVPPLWPILENIFGGFTNVLLGFAGLTLLIFPLIALAGSKGDGGGRPPAPRLTWLEVKQDLADPVVILLLAAMLFLYSGTALVFYFVAGYAEKIGLSGIGFFFTLTTIAEIGVRIVAGGKFDRMNKAGVIGITMLVLTGAYALLGRTENQMVFYFLAVVLGLGWGVAMPLFNGLMFDISESKYRAFNTNLGLQMFQAGYFFGPFLGGFLLERWSFISVFYFCAGMSVVGASLMFYLNRKKV